MEIEFVCHASVVLRRDSVHLISDPWLVGTAFDNGWALLAEPVFRPEDFASVTHIWFSHEHPDHFSARTLSLIPPAIRSRITVLFHSSLDKKVVQHCEKLGFGRVIELETGQWHTLATGFDILCSTWPNSDDSWLLVRTPETTLLNLNDCQANTQADVDSLHALTGDVDVLLTQYSISAWDGNAEDQARRCRGAETMLERTVRQARTLNAKHVVPFASFVWFCHEENFYMNSAMRPVGDAVRWLNEHTGSTPIVLYPGDRWQIGESLDCSSAVERYAADLASVPFRPRVPTAAVDFATLESAAAKLTARVIGSRSPLRLRISAVKAHARHLIRRLEHQPILTCARVFRAVALLQTRPARLWIDDHHCAYEFSLPAGLMPAQHSREGCDIALSSQALLYSLQFLWGGETLQINGRFHEIQPDGRAPLLEYLGIALGLNRQAGALARPL